MLKLHNNSTLDSSCLSSTYSKLKLKGVNDAQQAEESSISHGFDHVFGVAPEHNVNRTIQDAACLKHDIRFTCQSSTHVQPLKLFLVVQLWGVKS